MYVLYVCMYVYVYFNEWNMFMYVCMYVCMGVVTYLSSDGCGGFGYDVVLLLALQLDQREPQPHIHLIEVVLR